MRMYALYHTDTKHGLYIDNIVIWGYPLLENVIFTKYRNPNFTVFPQRINYTSWMILYVGCILLLFNFASTFHS